MTNLWDELETHAEIISPFQKDPGLDVENKTSHSLVESIVFEYA